MATYTDFSKRYERVRSQSFDIANQTTLLNDEVRRGAVSGDPDNIDQRAGNLDRQINANIDELNILSEEIASSDLTPVQQESLQNAIDDTGYGMLESQSRLDRVVDQSRINTTARSQSQTPVDSAGDIVGNDQDAQAEGATVQSPKQGRLTLDENGNAVPQPENNNTGSNARVPNTENDIVSNNNTTTTEQDANRLAQTGETDAESQGIPQTGSPVGNDPTGGATSTVGGDATTVSTEQSQKSESALNEDAKTSTQSTTATSTAGNGPTVAQEFIEPIVSKENILSGISNMTYGLSWYLLNPDEFADFVIAEEKVLPSAQLLVQSAGAPINQRNEWFNVDFYIENFTLESVVGTQATGSPHNAVTLEFDVVEPQGITLLNRLNNAVIDSLGENVGVEKAKASALAQNYLMVIRFYGYDAAGNFVTAGDLGLPNTTDENAIQEKFIPFVITNFGYKISTKNTEYRISGACLGSNIAFGTARGAVPFNLQLTASTVNQLFNGDTILADTQDTEEEAFAQLEGNAPPVVGLSGATITQGLTEALNDHQQKLAAAGSADIPDQYEIIFQDPTIRNAKIVKPGKVSKTKASNLTSEQAARKYLTSKLNYDKDSQTYNVLAGTQIVQLIDLLLRTSTYVTDQQNVYIDEKTGKPVGPQDPNGVPQSVPTVQWYRVKTQVVPLGYDEKRKTIAYKITYLVNKYQINTPRSAYFPNSEYRGVHKLYNYWFTGQNTEVLDFEINVDNNYFVVMGNDGRLDEQDPGKFGGAQIYSSAPGHSLQNGERGSSVPAANLSDRLYSYADVASAELEIVGDPDWIQQSELVYNKSLTLAPFTPDGSVNYDSSEVLFELRFNPVQDYDLETGLSNVFENNRDISVQGANGIITQPNAAQESIIWCATTVTSMFKQGSFTQRLSGFYRPLESSKNAPVNPQSEVILSDGNTVAQSLAEREKDNEPTGAVVGGVQTNAGGAANRGRAQAQRNLDRNQPRTDVSTSRIGGRSNAARNNPDSESKGIVVEIIPDGFPDEDAGTSSTRRIGGRSAAGRRR